MTSGGKIRIADASGFALLGTAKNTTLLFAVTPQCWYAGYKVVIKLASFPKVVIGSLPRLSCLCVVYKTAVRGRPPIKALGGDDLFL